MAKKRRLKKAKADKGNILKTPEITRGVSKDHLFPNFNLATIQSGKYCLSSCNKDEQAAFVTKLHTLSKVQWKQIKTAPRHGLGTEKIDKNAIKEPMPKEVTEDVTLLSIRFSGKAPMVGYQSGQTFNILWLDRDFTLYQH